MKKKILKKGYRIPFKPERYAEIQPNGRQVLKQAFLSINEWLPYYNMLNNLFDDPLTLIHDAKTISASVAVSRIATRFSYPIEKLYHLVCVVFNEPKGLRLSKIIDLSDAGCFSRSVTRLLGRLKNESEAEARPAESIVYGIGTLPLFGPETYLRSNKNSNVLFI
ncbi:MAG: hypothetical protein ACOYXT_29455 [Bacteroidota bacterium]